MTFGMSLSRWQDIGQLSREIVICNELAKRVGKYFIYTYGSNENKYLNETDLVQIGIQKQAKFWNYKFIPIKIFRVFNLIWNIYCVVRYSGFFKSIDIIKTNQFRGSGFGLFLSKIFNKKLVVRMGYYHGHISGAGRWRRMLEKFIFSRADKIIVTDKRAATFISTSYSIPITRLVYLPNSILLQKFKPIEGLQKKYDIIYVGRLNAVKNLTLLVDSISLSNIPKLKVLFIGRGPQEKLIMKKAASYQIDLEIINRIENSQLPYYYNISKLFILVSQYEGNPKVLLEAMACGLPVIGSNVPGINSVITHDSNGLLCALNQNEIAGCIKSIMSNSEYAERLGKNAQKSVSDNSLENIISQEEELYSRILYSSHTTS